MSSPVQLPDPFEWWGEHAGVALGDARVMFTTRRGGVSSGPFESLNLGRLTDDSPVAVEHNRQRVQEQAGRPLAQVHQVHGATVRTATEGGTAPDGPLAPLEEADGVVTVSGTVAPTVLVADCLPVAVSGGGGVAMLHAGWRGLDAGVLREGVSTLRQLVGDAPLRAAIGPGIEPCCYEVGDEVRAAFARYGEAVHRGRNLDLRTVARLQLTELGVEVAGDLDLCTACSPELFFSHRRDHGVTGRQAGVAWLS